MRQCISNETVEYPRLHQHYSLDGMRPGPSTMAGTIFTSILYKYTSFLPAAFKYIPHYTMLNLYRSDQVSEPILEINITNFPPRTERRRAIKRKGLYGKAIQKRRRLIEETAVLDDYLAAGPSGLQAPIHHHQQNRNYTNFTTAPQQAERDTQDVYYEESLSHRFTSLRTKNYQTVDYNWLLNNIFCIKVAIYGHSFVTRLEPFISQQSKSKIEIRFFGIPGARISEPNHRYNSWIYLEDDTITKEWQRYQPDLTFHFWGGNDIASYTQPSILAASFKSMCDSQDWAGDHIILSIESRYQVRENQVSLSEYETIRSITNDRLAEIFQNQFWNLDSFWDASETRNSGGTHLNNKQ
jgi:hypothetical protein